MSDPKKFDVVIVSGDANRARRISSFLQWWNIVNIYIITKDFFLKAQEFGFSWSAKYVLLDKDLEYLFGNDDFYESLCKDKRKEVSFVCINPHPDQKPAYCEYVTGNIFWEQALVTDAGVHKLVLFLTRST